MFEAFVGHEAVDEWRNKIYIYESDSIALVVWFCFNRCCEINIYK